MSSYGQYCPVAKAAEVLGERWTLLIVRDLLMGAHHFNELHAGLPGISRTLLASRLRRLERDGLVDRRVVEGRPDYTLTRLGEDLRPAVLAVGEWAARNYGSEPTRAELDPAVLLLWIERHARRDALPDRRTVVRFELRGQRPARAWLLIEGGEPTMCHDDPGFETELVVTSDTRTLYRVFAGRQTLAAAMRDGSVALDGSAEQRRGFTRWFGRSPFAPAMRGAAG